MASSSAQIFRNMVAQVANTEETKPASDDKSDITKLKDRLTLLEGFISINGAAFGRNRLTILNHLHKAKRESNPDTFSAHYLQLLELINFNSLNEGDTVRKLLSGALEHALDGDTDKLLSSLPSDEQELINNLTDEEWEAYAEARTSTALADNNEDDPECEPTSLRP